MKIEHVAMWTTNIEQLKKFYIEYFNGKSGNKYINEKKHFESYFIEFDEDARLEIMSNEKIKSRTSDGAQEFIGLAHIAFSVGSVKKVDELTDLLKNKGYEVVSGPRRTGDGYYESCILDPDGNRVEITE
ncbi:MULTISPECIES: VOC family protein [Clostridium]|uniref:VOC family protein n=1 Tax=Clostridium TaxID=1485 RepID=UPI000825D808|nr:MULTISPECIES: VOC family protein [Clostridium]PJI09611.1 glyoxalase/bleomycin resistance/extradiol dioxygenase family protein [Clostridium sp. CT7]